MELEQSKAHVPEPVKPPVDISKYEKEISVLK